MATLGASLQIVDTHCHLWRVELAEKSGLTKEFGPLFRTFDPADLFKETSQSGVERCVLVESGKTVEEGNEMERMAASSSLIAAIAPYVDLESPTLDKDLDRWRDNPKFRGVRSRFEAHPDPGVLARPTILDGLRKVAERGIGFEFLVRAMHLKDILKIYERIPKLRAVINHMAKPDFAEGTDRSEWQTGMKALAAHTRIACKLSLSPREEQFRDILKAPGKGWPVESIKPYVRFMLEHFGPNRLMWGSDWPVAILISDYRQTLDAMRAAMGTLPRIAEEKIFRNTALEFYRQ